MAKRNLFQCIVCGVALTMAAWHCPIHATKFAAGPQGPLHRPPITEPFRGPVDLRLHVHAEADGTAKPIRTDVVQAATGSGGGNVVLTPGTGTLTVTGMLPTVESA